MAEGFEQTRNKAVAALRHVVDVLEGWAQREGMDEDYQRHLDDLTNYYWNLSMLADEPTDIEPLDRSVQYATRIKQYIRFAQEE